MKRKPGRALFAAVLLVSSSIIAWGALIVAAASPLTWGAPLHVDSSGSITGVSCPSAALCVVVDQAGNVVTSTNPTGPVPSWTVANVDGVHVVNGISCPTTSLCVAVDNAGNVVTATLPAGGASGWTVAHVDGSHSLNAVSCPSTSFCVAVDNVGNALTSTNPTGGSAAWTANDVDGVNLLSGVSCPTSSLCVAVDFSGNVVTGNPTAGPWKVTFVDPNSGQPSFLDGVSCPNTGFCVAVDGIGDVLASTNPTGTAQYWPVTHVDSSALGLDGVSCPSGGFCVAVDSSGSVVTSTNPTGGLGAWLRADIDSSNFLAAVSCASSGAFCMAVDGAGNVVLGTRVTTSTVTSVSSSANPATVGTAVTYTSRVSPVPDGGTIAFTDNSTTLSGCGSVAVNTITGQAACTTTYTVLGDHAIVAAYSGDSSYTASSGSLTQQVDAVTAVLPAVSNSAYGGYVTATTIQNTGAAPASIQVRYFDQNGAPVGAGDSIASLPVNASWTVRQDNGNSFPSSGGNAAQAGSAVIYSSQPAAAFVNEFAPGNVGDATSYSGVQVPGGVGTTLYAPTIVNNAYGGYTTGIGLLNEGTGPTDVTITYLNAAGAQVKNQTVTALAAHAYHALYSGDSVLGLPSGFAGTATITSSAGEPLGAVVNETGPGGQFSSYDAVPAGSATLNVPVALNNAFGGYFTGMGIQNTTATAGSVSVTYYDAAGAPTLKNFTIPANGSLGVYQGSPTDGPAVGAYTATITSTLALAAIVNEVAPSSTSAQQSTSYNTFSAGSSSLHLPLVENAGTDPWNTGEGIMNTGSSTVTVQVSYHDSATGGLVGTLQTQILAPNAFWGLYQPTGGLPSGSRATAVVFTSSGGQLAVICNESSTTTFMSYDAQ